MKVSIANFVFYVIILARGKQPQLCQANDIK